MTPQFIGIGTPKSATTWIAKQLNAHPDICIPPAKEVDYFFDENYKKGWGWYEEQFAECQRVAKIGEYSPNYLYDEKALHRIKNDVPNAKLIVCLRNPVERFFSQHYFEYALGRHSYKTVSDIPEGKLQKNLERGYYAKYLKKWLSIFPQEQLLILFYEDILEDPERVITALYMYLDVRADYRDESTQTPENVSHLSRTRSRGLKNLYYRAYRHYAHSPQYGIYRLILRKSGVRLLLKKLLLLNDRQGTAGTHWKALVPKEDTERLAAYYREDVQELRELTGRDPKWFRE